MLPPSLPDLTFRPATNSDGPAIMNLVFGVLREFGLEPDPISTDVDLQDIEANYQRRGGIFEIIEGQNGALVGTVGVFPIDANTCQLRKMYFVPAIRGLGLGSQVLRRAIDHAKELGFRRMELETSNRLTAANRLYRRFGFQPFAAEHLPSRADQSYSLDLYNADSRDSNEVSTATP